MDELKSVIGEQLIIRGDIAGEEDIIIYGRIQGDLRIDGSVVLEASGIVKGTINSEIVVIRGILIGDIIASNYVEISPDGRMVGNVTTPHLILQEGGTMKGQVKTEEVPAGERKSTAVFDRTASRAKTPDRTIRRSPTTPAPVAPPKKRPGEISTPVRKSPSSAFSTESTSEEPVFHDTASVRSTPESND